MRASIRKTPTSSITSSEISLATASIQGAVVGGFTPTSLPTTIPSYASPAAFQTALLQSLPNALVDPNAAAGRNPTPAESFPTAPLAVGVLENEILDHTTLLTEIWQNNQFSSMLFSWLSSRYPPDIEPASNQPSAPTPASPESTSYHRQDQAVAKLISLSSQPHPYAKLKCLASVLELMDLDFVDDSEGFRQLLLDVIQQAKVPRFRAELDVIRYFAIYDNKAIATFLEVVGE